MVSASHFRELEVWRVSMELVKRIYVVTRTFPADERFGLTAQLRRAAVGIPSNIAEGNARHSTRDYARFVSIASGSTAEVHTQLLLCRDLGFGSSDPIDELLGLCERVSQMLTKLYRSLETRAESTTTTATGSRVPGPGSRP